MDRGMVVCIYFVHLYFAFVFSSRKHRENVCIWCIYLTRLVLVLMHHHGPLHSVIGRRLYIHLFRLHGQPKKEGGGGKKNKEGYKK